jgi:hypothetical protein
MAVPKSRGKAGTATAADAAGGDAYIRFVASQTPALVQASSGHVHERPLLAHLPSDHVAPPRGSHRRKCRLCAPSLLQVLCGCTDDV